MRSCSHFFLCLALLSLASLLATLLYAEESPVEQLLPENSKMCGECHDEIYNSFLDNVHARLRDFEFSGTMGGCEGCHGPGQRHMDSGDPGDIYTYGQKEAETDNTQCLKCHRDDDFAYWAHGSHAQYGVACTECHTIHKGKGKAPNGHQQLELCARCHTEVRAQMLYPSHHPVREGKMSCASCHNVHGQVGFNSLTTRGERNNELCLTCHPRYQGPFIFEHAPVNEDCLICHSPHGSVANNLLKQNEPFLCLQCHTSHFHTARVGETSPTSNPVGSVTNRFGTEGFMRAFGTKCTQCHIRIHGSDLPSQGTSSRGGSLTR
ncbi:MAG: DmsE family decaheme c-type cytochrome [Acidobacteria bacterium]|nr:DmsE family decaheme c-type cytochrome [Acidobacteriota bacterium]